MPKEALDQSSPKLGCYQYFGIRSNLHHFYDYSTMESEEADLYRAQAKGRRGCSRKWCKLVIWFGINFLIVGGILLLIGNFTHRMPVLTESEAGSGHFALIDHHAMRFNSALEVCGTVGIVLLCMGGSLVLAALVLPHVCKIRFDENYVHDPEKGSLHTYSALLLQPSSPVEKTIPVKQLIYGVQPKRKQDEELYQAIGDNP